MKIDLNSLQLENLTELNNYCTTQFQPYFMAKYKVWAITIVLVIAAVMFFLQQRYHKNTEVKNG